MGAGIRARGCAGPRLRAAGATGHCAYDGGMPWNRRLPRHALRALRRVVLLCAVTALLGLVQAACEESPEPLIATPSAIEVAVMEAAQEAPPSPTSAAAEPAATARTGTPAPTARAPVQDGPQPAAAEPVVTATATPSATPTPPLEPLDDEAVNARLREAASLIERVTGSPAALRAGPDLRVLLEAAALEFLERYGPDPEAASRLDVTIGQLPPLVYDLAPQGARIAAADVDGDGQNELIAAWHLIGVPPVWFDQGDAGFIAHAFPVRASAATARSMTFVRSMSDLTDDGVADVLLVSTTPGATTQTEDVRVYTWDDGTPRRVFDVAVVFGSGPAGWELRAATSPAEIETVCPALGHFDAALLPHPGLRRTFGWDGKQFHEVARRLDSPVSRHDQINRGEAAFWAGRYDDAEAAYRAVIETPAGGGDQISSQPDWEGLARLRLAQIGLLKIQAFDRARAGRRARARGRHWLDRPNDAGGGGKRGSVANVCGAAAAGPRERTATRRLRSDRVPHGAGAGAGAGQGAGDWAARTRGQRTLGGRARQPAVVTRRGGATSGRRRSEQRRRDGGGRLAQPPQHADDRSAGERVLVRPPVRHPLGGAANRRCR